MLRIAVSPPPLVRRAIIKADAVGRSGARHDGDEPSPSSMRAVSLVLICCLFVAAAILFVLNGMRNARFAAEAVALADDPSLTSLDGQYFDFERLGDFQVSVGIFTRSDCPISNR